LAGSDDERLAGQALRDHGDDLTSVRQPHDVTRVADGRDDLTRDRWTILDGSPPRLAPGTIVGRRAP
jgi:hypothetical protein